jgi:hypothetical protein
VDRPQRCRSVARHGRRRSQRSEFSARASALTERTSRLTANINLASRILASNQRAGCNAEVDVGISLQFPHRNSSVVSVASVTDPRQPHDQHAFLLKPPRPLPTLVRGDFVSEVILIIRLPVRPSRLKAISMPTVLRNVWQRRNRPARARGFLGHPAVLSGTSSPAAIRARRRSEALPA